MIKGARKTRLQRQRCPWSEPEAHWWPRPLKGHWAREPGTAASGATLQIGGSVQALSKSRELRFL